MRKQINLTVKPKFINTYKKGYPLILKDAILNTKSLQEEGTIINLQDEKNQFLGKGYYGNQNKGYGWVLTSNEDAKIDEAFFSKKILEAFAKRKDLFNDLETTAFRVFNGEGDGIGGLTIDYFDGYYVINWYSLGIYSFREDIINSLKQIEGLKGIYQKKRFSEAGQYIEQDDFVMGESAPSPLIVKESGVNFAVYLNDGAMVGVFLDQREVRKTIRDHYSKNKTVLNTFSYTGAFSIFAAVGGAKMTTSVDLANRSLPKTVEQFEINYIDPKKHQIIVEDVFHYFKYAVKKKLKFDRVILDPPSFAKSKNFKFSAAKDYKDLLKQAIAITENNGVIVASTNCSSFNMNKFKGFIKDAFKETNHRYEILEQYTLPSDFKTIDTFQEGDYLKVVFIRKQPK